MHSAPTFATVASALAGTRQSDRASGARLHEKARGTTSVAVIALSRPCGRLPPSGPRGSPGRCHSGRYLGQRGLTDTNATRDAGRGCFGNHVAGVGRSRA